jgi:hypothetical protein
MYVCNLERIVALTITIAILLILYCPVLSHHLIFELFMLSFKSYLIPFKLFDH